MRYNPFERDLAVVNLFFGKATAVGKIQKDTDNKTWLPVEIVGGHERHEIKPNINTL